MQKVGIGVGVNIIRSNSVPVAVSDIFSIFTANGVTPRAAFSFRLLNSAYTGACCRIRRSSDNAEQDINFVAGVVDTASINSFVPNGSTGYIVYIYDQTGNNRHRYTGIAIRQPEIKSAAGSIYTQNGKVAVRLNSANHTLQQDTSWHITGANSSSFMVYRESAAQDNIVFFGNTNAFGFVASSGSSSSAYGFMTSSLNKVNNVTQTISTRGEAYTQLSAKTGAIAHYTDMNLQTSFNAFNFGGYGLIGGFVWDGYYQEEIYCDGLQVSNATLSAAVWANQQAYYTL
jgi:hypothetical protein